MLHVPAQRAKTTWLRLLVDDLSFLRGSELSPMRFHAEGRDSLFHTSKADSSLILLFISAMDQQVSEDIRSRLEHCALEELLTDDKVISLNLLGELCRLTCGRLRSVNGVSHGYPRDRTTTLLKLSPHGRIQHPMTRIQDPSPRLRAGIHCPKTGIPEHPNSVHCGQSNPKTSAS
jgi:hypothetical protein